MENLAKIRSFALGVCGVAVLALTAPAFAQHGGVAVAHGGGYGREVDIVVAITVDIAVATMADIVATMVTAVGMAATTRGAGDGLESGFISQPCRIITRPIGTAACRTTTRTTHTSSGIPR